MPPSQATDRFASPKICLLLLTLIVLAYCAWVLSLPLFPTQDGPMHLYFTHVLQAVLTHPEGLYGRYYFVRHLLPPYALYYYLLMLLSSIVPILLADKIVICLFFFSFAFGFRYVASAVGPNGDVMALLATILLLNWPLGMGFVNFCLSTSFALWALGLWCRAAARKDDPRKIAFVILCIVIMFTHPVPLLAIGGFCAVELCIRLSRFRRDHAHEVAAFLPRLWLRDALYLVVAMATLAYVKLFTVSNILHQVHKSPEPLIRHEVSLLRGYVLLHSLAPFSGQGINDAIYRIILYTLLAGSLWLTLRQYVRMRFQPVRGSDQSQTILVTWTLVSVLFLLCFVFIPSDLNNSAYFSARLILFIWLAAMIAASGARYDHPQVRPILAATAICTAALTLFMAYQRINPIARQIALSEGVPSLPTSGVGLLLHDPAYKAPSTISYDPFFWSGVRMFRRTDSILYNTPWLDLPIIPLGPRSYLPTGALSSNDLEYPPGLRTEMAAKPATREFVLSHVGFAVISFGLLTPSNKTGLSLTSQALAEPRRSWACKDESNYSVCTTTLPPVTNLDPEASRRFKYE